MAPLIFLFSVIYPWIHSSRDNENVKLKIMLKKLSITVSSLLFMIRSKDASKIGPKYVADPDLLVKTTIKGTKTVVFIRLFVYLKSIYNYSFNYSMSSLNSTYL